MPRIKRQPISKSLRFEVFKRDSFTCQYCGRKAPDVILEVDHIQPVAKDGTSNILNLITSCHDCNAGKSDKTLSDDTVVERQREQLEELQERREQLDMMIAWQNELLEIEKYTLDTIADFWSTRSGFNLNENGRLILQKLIREFTAEAVIEAIIIAIDSYMSSVTHELAELAFSKIGGICHNRLNGDNDKDLHYICGILKNRLHYFDKRRAMATLKEARMLGVDFDTLKEIAITSRNWTAWNTTMQNLLTEEEHE